jgi:hypothetical protein
MTSGQAIGEILPLAIGIAVSPVPIVAVILMLFSPRARSNGPAFLLGWVAGLIVAGVIILVLAEGGDVGSGGGPSTTASWIKLLLGVGLLFLALRQWRGRPQQGEQAKVPKWMQAIDTVTPVKAAGLGALLSSVNPKNLALAIGAALAIAQLGLSTGDTAVSYGMFVVLGSLGIAVPVIYYLVGGEGAKKTMDGWKAWLLANNAAVMAVLFLVMGASLLGKGIAGVFG